VACVDRDFLYKYVNAKQKYKAFTRSTTPTLPTKSLLEILEMMRLDTRFDGLFESPGYWNLPILFASREEIILEYFNLWTVTRSARLLILSNLLGAESNIEELFDISILLLAAATPAPSYLSSSNSSNEKLPTPPHSQPYFDFFLLHLLLSCHAVRVLFKNLPYHVHNTLLEAQFLATISYYVSELRPQVKVDIIKDYKVTTEDDESEAMDWAFIRKKCFQVNVAAECANGGNYVKGKLSDDEADDSVESIERGGDGVRI
jgi:Questin oxidase-like